AVGSPGAGPAPPGEPGVTSGDGLFDADEQPRVWLSGLPSAAKQGSGEAVWLGGKAAAHLGADGTLRTTADGGATWQPVRWQPGSGGEGDLAWRAGRDYWIELPDGERAPPLALVWNDRRVADKEELFFGTQGPDGSWKVLAHMPQGILTEDGSRLP